MRPVLFELGPLTIHSYGFFLAIAFFVGIQLAQYFAKKDGFDPDMVATSAIGIIVSALIGAKGLYILVNWGDVTGSWDDLMSAIQRGFVFYGGFFAAFAFVIVYLQLKKNRIPSYLGYLDIVAPAVPLGLAFGRMGCFLSGCCFGAPTTLPWAVTFPENSFASSVHGWPHALHPSQLYAIALGLATFGFLMYIRSRRKTYGEITATFLLCYSMYRPVLEALRSDTSRGVYFGITTSQWISVVTFLIAAGFFWYIFSHRDELRIPDKIAAA